MALATTTAEAAIGTHRTAPPPAFDEIEHAPGHHGQEADHRHVHEAVGNPLFPSLEQSDYRRKRNQVPEPPDQKIRALMTRPDARADVPTIKSAAHSTCHVA